MHGPRNWMADFFDLETQEKQPDPFSLMGADSRFSGCLIT